MDYMEFKGKTKNDAITEACRHFSVPSDKLDYVVVEEEKSGFLGIGAKPAIIKAKVKEDVQEEVIEPVKIPEVSNYQKPKSTQNNSDKPHSYASNNAAEPRWENVTKSAPVDSAEVEAVCRKFLDDVFAAMKLTVKIDTKYNEQLRILDIELSGDEMGVLIGKRGQTLDSLQYLVSLVINKGTTEYIRVKVDTENYRQRRKETLENLAKNISYKVKRTKRPVALEPMNPYERRIIHSALQNDRYVTTHSEGEEPYRRVVVTLKRQ